MIGIVILNYNHWELAEECALNVLDTLRGMVCRTYIVDNASPTPMPESLRMLSDNGTVVIIRSPVNRGYAAGNNLGIARAIADGCTEIGVVNPDVRFTDGAIQHLVGVLRGKAGVGIVGPRVRLGDGDMQEVNMVVRTELAGRYAFLAKRTPLAPLVRRYLASYTIDDGETHGMRRVHAVSGCCFFMSRACAEAITPFDERTFLYHEELIIGVTMEAAGFETLWVPSAVVVHGHGVTTQAVKPFALSCMVESEMYYFRTYRRKSVIAVLPLYLVRTIAYIVRIIDAPRRCNNIGLYFKRTWPALINADAIFLELRRTNPKRPA